MTQDKMSALLGRPLSSAETTNFQTYLELAQSKVSDLLCVDICRSTGVKRFPARLGYKTLNVPIFTEIDYVKVNGVTVTSYSIRQGSRYDGDWYNSIVFNAPSFNTPYQTNPFIEIKADWGFSKMPVDVQMLVAELFSMVTDRLEDDLVLRKDVEDFKLTLKDKTKQEAFAQKYAATIAKYSGCVRGELQSGDLTYHYGDGLGYARHLLNI